MLFFSDLILVSCFYQEKKTVQMMFKQAKFKMGHVEEVPAQVLELPYVGAELSMLILLPDENTDLAVVSPWHEV